MSGDTQVTYLITIYRTWYTITHKHTEMSQYAFAVVRLGCSILIQLPVDGLGRQERNYCSDFCTHVGDLAEAPDSRLQPGSDLATAATGGMN